MASIDDLIARVEAIPGLAKRAAPDVAEAVRESVLATITAGTNASGEPWEPRKEDGGRPLVGAARALKVAAVGTRIFARLKGPEARHHLGRGKGGVRRMILPVNLTPELAARVRAVLVEHFRKTIEGG